MNRRFTREDERRLLEARQRSLTGRADGFVYEGTTRLAALEKALDEADDRIRSELCRHVAVAAVAALESHFRAIVAAIVDANVELTERGLSLVREGLRPSSDAAVLLLHRKVLSIGEIVATLLPFSSLAHIEGPIETLLGGDLKQLVATVQDPYFVRNGTGRSGAIVENVNLLWGVLARAFEWRHIVAHEAAVRFDITLQEAFATIKCIRVLVEALHALLWNGPWQNVPLTQRELNEDAGRRYHESRGLLAAKLRVAYRIATEDGERARFRKAQLAWKVTTRDWVAWEAEPSMGSIRPMISAKAFDGATVARVEAVERWTWSRRPEGLI